MLIPNKFGGFHNGVRRCFGGGGGGGGGDGDGGGGNTYIPPATTTNTNTTTNTGANTNFSNTGNTSVDSGPGVSTAQFMATLKAAQGTPWGQSGGYYNDLLNQGFTSNQIKTSASDMYGAPSDANWGAMVQNAGMNSPTGRPMAGSDQFFQPVYQSSYQNFARPATQFDTSTYGTQPVRSPASSSGMSRSNINSAIDNFYNTNPLGRDAPMSATLDAMRSSGINRSDIQQWGGVNNYAPQQYNPYAQAPYNPYTAGYGMGSGFLGANQGYGSGYGAQAPQGPSNQYTSPFQYSQVQNPFTQQQSSYSGSGGLSSLMPQMQNPYMSQQQYSQPSMAYSPMSNPYMQQSNLYNYQPQNYQPSYQSSYGGGYDDSGYNYQQPTPPPPPQRTSSGPTNPIVGRSAGFRGTPNVMRRAEGGIIELMDKQ